jgi:ComF family protein
MNIVKKIKNFLLDIFFPSFCSGCKKEGSFLCKDCKYKIEILKTPSCFPEKAIIKKFYCATEYRNRTLKNLMHNFKYKYIKEINNELSEIMIKHLKLTNFEPSENQILVPVPLHKKRLQKRGFNQSELLAEKIGKYFNIQVDTKLIKRKKETKHQTLQEKRKERKENLKNAFSFISKKDITKKEIILVDDIITTGTTLKECAKTLAKKKVKNITAIVIAK